MPDALEKLRAEGVYAWPLSGERVGFRPSTPEALARVKESKAELLEVFDTTDLTFKNGVVFGAGFWFTAHDLDGCYWCGHSTVERRFDGVPMHSVCFAGQREKKFPSGREHGSAVLLLPDGTPDPEPKKWRDSRPSGWSRKPPPPYKPR